MGEPDDDYEDSAAKRARQSRRWRGARGDNGHTLGERDRSCHGCGLVTRQSMRLYDGHLYCETCCTENEAIIEADARREGRMSRDEVFRRVFDIDDEPADG